MIMNYPEDFKRRVKQLYPDWGYIHEKLEEGHPCVGLYLYADSHREINVTEEIFKLNSMKDLKELQDRLRKEKETLELYIFWSKIRG